ncbi:hypothetical protein A2U01_0087787, partial [Trifolium medium]|nr:hypothetical protein [Trifolium medium]
MPESSQKASPTTPASPR